MPSPDADALSPEAAIDAVWGPSRTWLAAVVVLAGGLGGAALASVLPQPGEWLRPWACAGYGVAIGGIVTLLPRFARLVALGSQLTRRPAGDGAGSDWWPLTFVASALRETPTLRRTAEDFRAAVVGFVPQARGLLAQRLWPACVAAFTAPVLGLVSAWLSWRFFLPEAIRRAKEQATVSAATELALATDWGVVAWPMVITIGLALLLMVAIVLADQLGLRLLQRWAATVRPFDADAPVVEGQLAGAADARLRTEKARAAVTRPTAEPAAPQVVTPMPPPEKPEPQISAEELQGLGDLFRNG